MKALLGENRQRYLERLKERLERRQRRQEEGLDPDEEDEEALRLLNEEEAASTGNILRDLQNRFDEEKDALLRRLQVRAWLFDIFQHFKSHVSVASNVIQAAGISLGLLHSTTLQYAMEASCSTLLFLRASSDFSKFSGT